MTECDRQGCLRDADTTFVSWMEGPQRGEVRLLADGCGVQICGYHKLWPEDLSLPGVCFHPLDTHVTYG